MADNYEQGTTEDAPDNASSVGSPTSVPQDETMHPTLKAFADALPEEIANTTAKDETGAASGPSWLSNVMTRINDWVTGRDIMDKASAHTDQYIQNLDTFKQGLVNMVKTDPTAVTVARDIVGPTLQHIVSSSLPNDQQAKVLNDIGTHIQDEVLETAINSMATKSPVLAKRMLDRAWATGDLKSPEKRDGFDAYIHAQDIAQRADGAAQQKNAQQDQARATAAAGHRFGEALVSPGGDFSAPPGWASKLIEDPNVSASEKGALMGSFGRLQQAGDVPESNGHAMLDAFRQMKNGSLRSEDIWNATGQGLNGLSVKDATWMNKLMHDETPAGRANRDAFHNALEDAAGKLMGKSGSEGAQGARDFNNYAKWLTAGYQERGLAGLDPQQDGYMFNNVGMNNFRNTPQVVNMSPSHFADGGAAKPVASYFRRAATSRRGRR